MGVRALRIAAIAFAGAMALAGCRKERATSGSSSTTNYGTSGPSGTSGTSSGTYSGDQRGTGGSSSSGISDDVNGTPRSTTEQTQEQQRQHDVTQQNPPKTP